MKPTKHSYQAWSEGYQANEGRSGAAFHGSFWAATAAQTTWTPQTLRRFVQL